MDNENGGQTNVNVEADFPWALPRTINLGYSGTATKGVDYRLAPSENVVIDAFELTGRTTTISLDDSIDEPNETVIVTVLGVNNGEIATPAALPAITILDDDPPPVPEISISSTSHGFGEVAVSGGSATTTFTINNVGAAPLTLTSTPPVRITGANAAEFTVIQQPPSSVAPMTQVSFRVTFDPAAVGVRQASIVIANNDSDENPVTVSLTGFGVPLSTITGTSGNDTYYVIRSGPQLLIYENTQPVGQPTYSSALADIGPSLTVDTQGGNDSLVVDTGGDPSLGLTQLIYNAGAGVNTLSLIGGGARIDSTAVGGTLNSTVQAGAQLTTSRLDQLRLALQGTDTKVTLLPNGGVAVLDDLELSLGTTLDVTNNTLVLHGTETNKDGRYADLREKIQSAQNGLDPNLITNWNGTGISSSTARISNVATGFDLVSLGLIRNSDLDITTGIPGSSYTSFGGEPVGPHDLLLKFTYIGDANLNGVVSFDDYVGMDNAFFELIPNLGWATGDVNFDNAINFDDYSKVDQAFFFQGAPLAASSFEEAPGFAGGSDAETEQAPSAGGSSVGVVEESVGLRPTLQVVGVPAQIVSSEAECRSTADPNLQAAISLADPRLSTSRRSPSRDLWDTAILDLLR